MLFILSSGEVKNFLFFSFFSFGVKLLKGYLVIVKGSSNDIVQLPESVNFLKEGVPEIFSSTLKMKQLSETHLSNVLSILSDLRNLSCSGGTTPDYYEADIVMSGDYSSFGASLESRSWNPGAYRYGFNGKEKDPEGLGGGGATYDYGFRIYNPNLGKFLSVDPISSKYPWYTPYQFAGNKPVCNIDLDGREDWYYISTNLKAETSGPLDLEYAKANGLYSPDFPETYPTPDDNVFYVRSPELLSAIADRIESGIKDIQITASSGQYLSQSSEEQYFRGQWMTKLNELRKFNGTLYGGGNNGMGLIPSLYTGATEVPVIVVGEITIAQVLTKLEKLRTYKNLVKVAKKIDVSTPENSAVFYSGRGNKAKAADFIANNPGKMTIEMTEGGKYFEAKDLYNLLGEKKANKIWGILSKRYAEGTSGGVVGFVEGASQKGIFNTIEAPILKKNFSKGKVTTLITEGN